MSATQYIETLNQVGRELSHLAGSHCGWPVVARTLRTTLKLDAVSVWTADCRGGLLVRESFDAEPALDRCVAGIDDELAQWQLRARTSKVMSPHASPDDRRPLPEDFEAGVASLAIESDGSQMTVLNLYASGGDGWYFDAASPADADEFFRSVGGQIEFFMRQKALEANATFYKEMHHRVKNNLQTVASLLRMHIRRLDRQSPQRALEDAIARIESIAVVHDTLAQGQIGLVDLGDLVQRIAALAGQRSARITLRLEGPRILLTSRQATSLALVANELVQNAVQHGSPEPGSIVEVQLVRALGPDGEPRIELQVRNPGEIRASGFDPAADGNLGLTIVRTLTTELSGDFQLESRAGHTFASVSFPAASLEQSAEPAVER